MFPVIAILRQFRGSLLAHEAVLNNFGNSLFRFWKTRKPHPAFCTVVTESFPGVKRPGLGVDHPPPSRAEVKVRVELYLYSSSVNSWPVIG